MTTPLPFFGDFGQAQFHLGANGSAVQNQTPVHIPDGARFLEIFLGANGGNGGAGASGISGSARGGGGGGGCGGQAYLRIPANFLPRTVYLRLLAGGASTASGLYLDAALSFPVFTCNAGGSGGTGTSSAAGSAGSGGVFTKQALIGPQYFSLSASGPGGAAGGALANGFGFNASGASGAMGTGGSGGSGVTTAGVGGGAVILAAGNNAPQQFAAAAGANGQDGYNLMMPFPFFTGGAGGGSADAAVGGNGGNGGPGCGGGGGGGGTTGGAGGLGGPAFAFVWFS